MTIVAVNGGGNTPNETRVATVNIQAVDWAGSTDDLDLAASTADADAFIDERYSFNFGDTSSSGPIITSIDSVTSNEPVNSTDDGLGDSSGSIGWSRDDTVDPSSDEPQQLTGDDGGAGAQGNWIWNVNVSTTHAGTPAARPAEEGGWLIGDGVGGAPINVDVDNDVVTLTGTVASAASRTDSTDRDSASADGFVFPDANSGRVIALTVGAVATGSSPYPDDFANVGVGLVGTSDALAPTDFFLV